MDRSFRILVADPDSDLRRTYIEALRPLGCDPIEASDGREALVEALARRPSVIVLETRLPFVNGPALCEILRRDSQTRSVPIIALADQPSADAERMRRAGADGVLFKPVAAAALVSELQRVTTTPPRVTAERVVAQTTAAAVMATPPGREPKRIANSKSHARCVTTTPPAVPPTLRCPSCDGTLTYDRSYIGGVSQRHPEQWDEYSCPTCGTFEYRHRTRKLRSGPGASNSFRQAGPA
jgi:CheY-like chemotaxis protein